MVELEDGNPAILECELFDPSLQLPIDPSSVDRFI
jgi:hypothetical protein